MENHIGELIINRMQQYENKVMLRSKSGNTWKQFTGKQAYQLIEKIALSLLAENVQHQEKVGIYSQNMPEWTLADVGSIAIGAVSVPIYATNIACQAKYIIEDADIHILFVGEQQQYDEVLKIIDDCCLDKVIVFDETVKLSHPKTLYFKDWLADSPQNMLDAYQQRKSQLQADDLATIIYTSGTTGEPKGVMLDHANIIQGCVNHDIKYHLTDKDSSLSFLPLSHVFERAWVFYILHKGMCNTYNADPKQIAEVIQEVQPTVMCSVPRLYEKIYHAIHTKLQTASFAKKNIFNWSVSVGKKAEKYLNQNKKIPFLLNQQYKLTDKLVFAKIREQLGGNLKFMPCGGAFLSAEITSFFQMAGLPVIIGYGLTETTATVTSFDMDECTLGTVGKTLPNTEIKIGKDDEILVRGTGVMKGYYNKPEETAKVFDEDGWFKTGDAGKIDADGNLIITDRIKDLIKTSGGKYIAPQHLEIVLTNHSFISQVIVIGEGKPYTTALLVPDFEALKSWANHKEIAFNDENDLIKNPQIIEKFNQIVDELQECLARFEKVKKFTLMPREFSMEEGELTPTFKPKRKVISEKYKDIIDKMYAE
ncbi:MAG: long-chain fatty acid--CoA ligase [Moraxellaceae bacterium]|nr:long-chain fatty acid--CoA ligase [Moraxellaceae bacterium]